MSKESKTEFEAIQKADVEIATKLFGEHPEDVLCSIKTTSDAVGWIEEIFLSIEKELEAKAGPWSELRFKRLARLGRHIAFEFQDYASCRHEEYERNLVQAGAIKRKDL